MRHSKRTILRLSLGLMLTLLACGPFATLTHPDAPGPAGAILWSADHETGDLSQWRRGAGSYRAEQDSGRCTRSVSSEQARSGRYAIKLTITTPSNPTSGCRQHRNVEAGTGQPAYYSAWFFIPQYARPTNGMWNIFQFKTKDLDMPARSADQAAIWTVNINARPNGRLYLVLKWHGEQAGAAGPRATDGVGYRKFEQALADVPVGRWFQIRAYLKQSHDFDGHLIIWQDGVELFNMTGIRTNIAGGSQRWAVNNYSNGLSPSTATIYIDDAMITSVASLAASSPCQLAAEAAQSKAGAIYSQGGHLARDPIDPHTGQVYPRTGPDSFDCSGLTQWAYQQVGIDIGPTTREQARAGTATDCTLEDAEQGTCWEVGDLLILDGHVDLYIGNRQFVGCLNHQDGCLVHTYHRSNTYQQRFIGARRIIPDCASSGGMLALLWKDGPAPTIIQDFGPTDWSTGAGAGMYDYGTLYGLSGTEHTGIDYGLPVSTRIYSPVAGVVIKAGGTGFYLDERKGNAPDAGEITIRLANRHEVTIGHMEAIGVRRGQRIAPGDELGRSGTFNEPHIHVEYRVPDRSTPAGQRIVDPRIYLGGSS